MEKDCKKDYWEDYRTVVELNKQIIELQNEKANIINKYENWLRGVIARQHKTDRYHKISFDLQHPLGFDLKNKDSRKYLYVELRDDYDHRDEFIDSYKIPLGDLLNGSLDVSPFSKTYREELKKKKETESKQKELLELPKEELVRLVLEKKND